MTTIAELGSFIAREQAAATAALPPSSKNLYSPRRTS